MIIEFIILVFFLCRFLHNLLFAEQASFWKDPKNIVVIVTIIVSTVILFTCLHCWFSNLSKCPMVIICKLPNLGFTFV